MGLTPWLLSTLTAPACNCTRNCTKDRWDVRGRGNPDPVPPRWPGIVPGEYVNSKETAVPPVRNGVRASSLDACWIKSRHSNAEGNCVEVATLADGGIALRNSRDPDGPALVYTPAEVAAFVAGAKDGEFDHLL
jgi:hypothetical protein